MSNWFLDSELSTCFIIYSYFLVSGADSWRAQEVLDSVIVFANIGYIAIKVSLTADFPMYP